MVRFFTLFRWYRDRRLYEPKGIVRGVPHAGSDVKEGQSFVLGLWGVRYQVKDVNRSIAFYTRQLGFKLDQQNLPAFAQVSVGNLKLILSGPGASGSRPMPDGRQQEPGGWNRVVLQVSDLPGRIEVLKKAGLHFRNDLEVGPGGKQIQVEDPDGNPIELFEPAR
jgi:glyoxylase I family protein